MKKRTLVVQGMHCQNCVNSVTKALSAVDGLTEVHVDLAKALATFVETKPVSEDIIRKAVSDIGFEPGELS
jgi:copper chaperone